MIAEWRGDPITSIQTQLLRRLKQCSSPRVKRGVLVPPKKPNTVSIIVR